MSVIDGIKDWLSSTDPEERAAGAELALEDSETFASLDLKTQVLCRVLRGRGEDFRAVIEKNKTNPGVAGVLNGLLKSGTEPELSDRIVDLLSEVGDANSVSVLLRRLRSATVSYSESYAEAVFWAVAGIIGRADDARVQNNLKTRINDVTDLPPRERKWTEKLLAALQYRKKIPGSASDGGRGEYMRWLSKRKPGLSLALGECRRRIEGNRHVAAPSSGRPGGAGWRALSRRGGR